MNETMKKQQNFGTISNMRVVQFEIVYELNETIDAVLDSKWIKSSRKHG